MNRATRNQIAQIIKGLKSIDDDEILTGFKHEDRTETLDKIKSAKSDLEEILNEEQDKFDNLPPAFQEGGQGDAMQEAIEQLESAIDVLDSAHGHIEEGPDNYPADPQQLDWWIESAVEMIEEAIEELEVI